MDSTKLLAGQVALVTGAGRGIGRASAVALARAGAAVGVLSRSSDELLATVAEVEALGGRALAVPADVTDRSAVAAAVAQIGDQFGAVDLLVNNAGRNSVFGPLWEVEPTEWWTDVTVNLFGPFLCSAAVLPAMIARGSGRIVNIVSGTAGRPFPHNSAYAASKAALVRLTDCLAAETGGRVSVFALGPGTVRTQLATGLERSEAGRRWLSGVIDQLRFTPVETAAAAVVWLGSGRADALSGRWVDAGDDLDLIADHAVEVGTGDLFQLRRAKLPTT
jgi:NAD(P)-dependent dehydrogenase (short-subunit alcohol dehydrogenase family)